MILPLILIKFKPMPRILPLFSKQLHNLFQHAHWFAIVAPHISAAYRECSSIFSTSRIGVHQFFLPFFVSSTFIIVSLFFTFYVHPFSFCSSPVFFLALSLHGLYCDILLSILIICNCFTFRFHHISYIYIYCCPFPSILFQRDPKTPSRRSSNLRCKIPISVLTLQMQFCKKYLNYSCKK